LEPSSDGRQLGSTYTIHLGLIGKRVVDFLLVNWNFLPSCYSWGATSEYQVGAVARSYSVIVPQSGIHCLIICAIQLLIPNF